VSDNTWNKTRTLTVFVGFELPRSSVVDLLFLRDPGLTSSYAFRQVMQTIGMYGMLLDVEPMLMKVGHDFG
jgi:hypothetical protein